MINKLSLVLLLSLTPLFAQENALQSFKNGKYKEAFQLYSIDAKTGDDKALSALSYLYINGLGVQKNEKKGIELLKKSAQLNNKNAQYDLGMMYLTGQHLKQDSKEAFNYLSKASKNKHLDATFNLALMYYQGDATDSNITKSLELLENAANRGHKSSIANIGRIYYQDFQFKKAIKWLNINVKNGDEEAEYLLQEIYTQKKELKKD